MGKQTINRKRVCDLTQEGFHAREIARILQHQHGSIIKIWKNEIPEIAYNKVLVEKRKLSRKRSGKIAGEKISKAKTSNLRAASEGCIRCLFLIGFGQRKINKIIGLPPGMAGNSIKKIRINRECKTRAYYNKTNKPAESKIKDRIARNFRDRIRKSLRGRPASMKTIQLLGCSIKEFKQHLERQMKSWMTWENYGKEWHIDHIVPCAKYDLTDPRQQKTCFHWTNLRPLCAKQNVVEGHRAKRSIQTSFML